jgi:hypothetical protein
MRHAQAVDLERAAQPVREEVRPEIPEVDGPIDGRTAGVHADLARHGRDEWLDAAAERVKEAHRLPFDKGTTAAAGPVCA